MDQDKPGPVAFLFIWLVSSAVCGLFLGVYPRSPIGLGLILALALPLYLLVEWAWARLEAWFDHTALGRRVALEAKESWGSGTRVLVALMVVLLVGGAVYFGAELVQRQPGVADFLASHLGHW